MQVPEERSKVETWHTPLGVHGKGTTPSPWRGTETLLPRSERVSVPSATVEPAVNTTSTLTWPPAGTVTLAGAAKGGPDDATSTLRSTRPALINVTGRITIVPSMTRPKSTVSPLTVKPTAVPPSGPLWQLQPASGARTARSASRKGGFTVRSNPSGSRDESPRAAPPYLPGAERRTR